MLSVRLTQCPECQNILYMLTKIDCRLAELGNSLYNNITYMLNKPVRASDMSELIAYKRILTYKLYNPNYVSSYSTRQIGTRVLYLAAGCYSKCNEPVVCVEEPCNIDVVPNPTTTSTSTTIIL